MLKTEQITNVCLCSAIFKSFRKIKFIICNTISDFIILQEKFCEVTDKNGMFIIIIFLHSSNVIRTHQHIDQ